MGQYTRQPMQIEEMRRWLEWYDVNVEQTLQDAQKENRAKLEWALDNAEKLRVKFKGIVDQSAIADAAKYMLALGMEFEPGHDPFLSAKTATKH